MVIAQDYNERNTESNIVRALKGTSVFDIEETKARNEIIDVIRRLASNYGYDEMTTPVIYEKDLLEYKFDNSAELADEIYSVTDRGARDLGLRYDLTVPLVRYVAQNIKSLRFPFKRFEVGEVFRDGPVKSGRARQFTQCDVDVVGDVTPVVTACEQMSLTISVLNSLGLYDSKVCYSSRRFAEGLVLSCGIPNRLVGAVIRIMDKKAKISEDEFESELLACGVSELAMTTLLDILDAMDSMKADGLDVLFDEASDSLVKVRGDEDSLNAGVEQGDWEDGIELLLEGIEELRALSVLVKADETLAKQCVFDPYLVRGQDYYTGIVFEAFADGFSSSLAGGGRYESIIGSLAKAVDEKTYSASGVSFGIVPIMYALSQRKQPEECDVPRRGIVVISCDSDDLSAAFAMVNVARQRLRIDIDASDRSVSKKIRSADRSGAAFIVVFGEEERESKNISVKNLETGISCSMAIETFARMVNEDDLKAFTTASAD